MNAENFEFDFAVLDAATQRTLRNMSPEVAVFKRESQIEESLIFYILSREDLGEISRIERIQRGAISCLI